MTEGNLKFCQLFIEFTPFCKIPNRWGNLIIVLPLIFKECMGVNESFMLNYVLMYRVRNIMSPIQPYGLHARSLDSL